MAYCVARTQKYKQTAVRGIEIHHEREGENHDNKDINSEKTAENFDAITGKYPEKMNFNTRVHKIIDRETEPLKHKRRSDAVVMAEVMVTASPEFFEGKSTAEVKRYFHDAAEYLDEQFGGGGKYRVAATVHMDETTPNMHYTFVPVDGERAALSAKNVLNRAALLKLQNDLPHYLQDRGWAVERGRQNSKAKHVKSADYKKQTRIDEKLQKVLKHVKRLKEKKAFLGGARYYEIPANEYKVLVDAARRTDAAERLAYEDERYTMHDAAGRVRLDVLAEDLKKERDRGDGLAEDLKKALAERQAAIDAALEEAKSTIKNLVKDLNELGKQYSISKDGLSITKRVEKKKRSWSMSKTRKYEQEK